MGLWRFITLMGSSVRNCSRLNLQGLSQVLRSLMMGFSFWYLLTEDLSTEFELVIFHPCFLEKII